MMKLFLAAVLMLALPAAASGTLDAGPLVIVMDNGQEGECVEDGNWSPFRHGRTDLASVASATP